MRKTDAPTSLPSGRAARCLILAAGGHPAPEALTDGLQRRQATCRVVQDMARVMVELARCPGQALIVIEPQTLPQADQLIAAVQRYHPRTALWQYTGQPQPTLRSLQPEKAPPAAPGDRSPAEPLPSPLISEEELEMLLGFNEPTEDQP